MLYVNTALIYERRLIEIEEELKQLFFSINKLELKIDLEFLRITKC